MSALQTYLHLVGELLRIRREHGEDSPEENEILDRMDQPWYDMTEEEREIASRHLRGDGNE